MKEGILSKPAGAAMATASGTAHLGKSFGGMASGVMGAGSFGYRGVKMVGAAMTYNPISLTWEAVSKRNSESVDPADLVPDDFEEVDDDQDGGAGLSDGERRGRQPYLCRRRERGPTWQGKRIGQIWPKGGGGEEGEQRTAREQTQAEAQQQ